jgi:redox-sensitive bicupin YhaK (pirin superfamily)
LNPTGVETDREAGEQARALVQIRAAPLRPHSLRGQGMWFIQIWHPRYGVSEYRRPGSSEEKGLEPSVEQRPVERHERTGRFLPLVSNRHPGALPIRQDAAVFSCFLEAGRTVDYAVGAGRGAYLYVVEGGPVGVAGMPVREFGAAKIVEEPSFRVTATKDAELLLVDVAV